MLVARRGTTTPAAAAATAHNNNTNVSCRRRLLLERGITGITTAADPPSATTTTSAAAMFAGINFGACGEKSLRGGGTPRKERRHVVAGWAGSGSPRRRPAVFCHRAPAPHTPRARITHKNRQYVRSGALLTLLPLRSALLAGCCCSSRRKVERCCKGAGTRGPRAAFLRRGLPARAAAAAAESGQEGEPKRHQRHDRARRPELPVDQAVHARE